MPATASKEAPSRARRRRTAPASSTPRLLRYLEAYLSGFTNRKNATMALLGCSQATATRITSRVVPYTAAMKMEWASRICAAAGQPLDRVLETSNELSCAQAVVGWAGLPAGPQAIQAAFDCAHAITVWAYENYGLSGDVIVAQRDGYPSKVKISLHPNPALTVYDEYGYYCIIITGNPMPDGSTQMWLRATEPGVGARPERIIHSGRLSHRSLRILLIDIYDRTKNIPRRLATESAQCAQG